MRTVASLADCNVLFREIFAKLDKLGINNYDLQKRRVVNASPSVDLYDYVVRKELLDLAGKGSGTTEATTVTEGSRYYSIVFTTAGTARVATYASGPYIFKRNSVSVIACAAAVTPPTSGTASFNLLHNGVAILNNDITLLTTTASLEVVTSTDFTSSPISFAVDDTLVLQVNASEGVAKVTIQLLVVEV